MTRAAVCVLCVCTCVYVCCVCEERRELSICCVCVAVWMILYTNQYTVYHTVQLYYILTCSNKPIYMQAMWRGLTVFHTVQLVQMRRATKMMQRSVHVCVRVCVCRCEGECSMYVCVSLCVFVLLVVCANTIILNTFHRVPTRPIFPLPSKGTSNYHY